MRLFVTKIREYYVNLYSLTKTMKISIIQTDIKWADPQANITAADAAVDSAPGSDLYVLPEMFSTGFCTRPEGVAEPSDGRTLAWMKRKAAATGAALAGSVAVCEDGKYYNRFYFEEPRFIKSILYSFKS